MKVGPLLISLAVLALTLPLLLLPHRSGTWFYPLLVALVFPQPTIISGAFVARALRGTVAGSTALLLDEVPLLLLCVGFLGVHAAF